MNKIDNIIEADIDKQSKISLKDSILKLIWRESQISRAEISRQLNLSRSTVTEIIKELLSTGFVAEVGSGESSGGRKPIVLEFQDDAKFILGIDIGATHISVALTNLRGNLLTWKEIKHPVREDPRRTWKSSGQPFETSKTTTHSTSWLMLSILFRRPYFPESWS